jgi:hypothetical protein
MKPPNKRMQAVAGYARAADAHRSACTEGEEEGRRREWQFG